MTIDDPLDIETEDEPGILGEETSKQRSAQRRDAEEIEQSFQIETGRYRGDDGEFVEGSPPDDYDSEVDRFRADDGQFKNRAADLGEDTPWDAPDPDSRR
jgi:hypothetical protein